MRILFVILALVGLTNHLVYAQKIGLGSKNKRIEVDYARPQEYTIGGITVVGTEFLDRTALISMTGLKEGDKIKIPSEETTNVIKKLWKSGIVGDARLSITKIEGDKAFLELSVKERPRLSRFVFTGISKSQGETLTDKIKLIKGRIVNDALLSNAINKIKSFYAEKGFKNVKVNAIQRKDSLFKNSNYVYINFLVEKNAKVKINDITIEGVTAFKDRIVKRKLKKTKEKRFGRIFSPSKFVQKEYEKDLENLMEFYSKNGYRNATVEFDTVYDHSEELVNIKIKVHEGKQYRYRNLFWQGNFVYSDTVLGKVLGINKGDIYNPEDLQKRLNFNPQSTDITSLYMDDGYLFFNVNPVEVYVGEDSIDVEMRIFEGEQANINKINLKGNTRTSDHVVFRELRTIPANKFSRSDLIRTQRELATLGYFDPEKINMNPQPNMADGTVDINYGVEEKPSDQLELSAGWGGFFGFVGTVGVVFNNFSAKKLLKFRELRGIPQGDGQRLSLRVQANGRQFQNYSFSFTEPWLNGTKPHSITFGVNHSINRRINPSTRQTLGSLQITGFNISMGRRLTVPDDWFTMQNSINYQRYSLNNFTGFGLPDGIFNNINFGTTIARNSLDNPTYPRSGSAVTLNVTFTPPYSLITGQDLYNRTEGSRWLEYHKWMIDNAWYQQIAGKLVLSLRTHWGFMGNYRQGMEISPFERFVLGGGGMMFNNFLLGTEIIALRGYTDQSIVPLQPAANGALQYRSDGLKGIIYNKYVMELRYPLSLNPSATIFALAFLEGGNNLGNYRDFNPFDIKRSAGIGARIFMPAFGMLGIDWAYGFDPIPGNSNASGRPQFHFVIGQQLR